VSSDGSVHVLGGCCEFAGATVFPGNDGRMCKVDKSFCGKSVYAVPTVFLKCFLREKGLAEQKHQKQILADSKVSKLEVTKLVTPATDTCNTCYKTDAVNKAPFDKRVEKRSVSCSTCYNSYKSSNSKRNGYSVEARVFHVIDASEVELKPVEIAQKVYQKAKPTSSQRSTVRVICVRLLQRGLIIQPYHGTYCNKITYGVMFKPLMVHNIRLHANVSVNIKSDVVVEDVGNVRVKVVFGEQRRKVSGFISCDVGLSHDACRLALNRWFDIAERRLGFALVDVVLTTFELNKDYAGVKIDGVNCMTRRDLFGFIERVYQKEANVVRKEVKASAPMSINRFEEAIAKGFQGVSQAQELFDLRNTVRDSTAALKFNNSRLLEIEKSYFAFVKNQAVMGDSVVNLQRELVLLREDFAQLMGVLSGLVNGGAGVEPVSVNGSGSGGNFEYVA